MKSNNSRTISLVLGGLLIIALLFFWGQAFISFLANHTYYKNMLTTGQNRGLVISALTMALIPVLYLFNSSKFTIKKRLIILASSITFFGLLHVLIKGDVVGFGRFITLFHTAFLICIGAYTLTGIFSIGSLIEQKLIKFSQHRRQELLFTFGIGLCIFLAFIQICIGIGIFYSPVARALFIGLGIAIYFQRKTIKTYGELLTDLFRNAQTIARQHKSHAIALGVLLTISIMYLCFGYQNSFIPYSTARDANHAYMFIPKVIAENGGVYRGNTILNSMPGMWHHFITFFFSLTQHTNGRLGISPDNMGVSMNFLSAILIIILSIGIVYQLADYLQQIKKEEKSDTSKIGVTIWRSTLLLRMTSGMGAFLVIVDNKTDLGVMAISSLALLSGIIFLGILQQGQAQKKEIRKYLILSGIFFAFACLAKTTAFVDIALFGIFLIGIRFSPICSLGIGAILAGVVRYLEILTSNEMLSLTQAKYLVIIGSIITLIGLFVLLLKEENREKIWTFFKYLCGLMISFLCTLVVFKIPRSIVQESYNETFDTTTIIKSLLAQANTEISIEEQSIIDEVIINSQAVELGVQPTSSRLNDQQSADACLTAGNIRSKQELMEGLTDAPQSNEDLGRYVGYGQKEFTSKGNAVYRLLKLFFPTSETCYGFDQAAKLLCSNATAVDNFDIPALSDIYLKLENPESQGGLLLKTAIEAFNTSGEAETFNPLEYRDYIVALRQFYQAYAISSKADSLSIPYRYLVPTNIIFNRSLQNLSSYYTDLGFTWIVIFIILIVALPYAIIKKDKTLISLSLTTLIGRGIWRIIGSAILRYGTVLISWTIMTLVAFFMTLHSKKEDKKLYLILGIILLAIVIQLFLNFIRIASQGATGPFVEYKGSFGQEMVLTSQLQQKTKTIFPYSAKHVFNLQFPQYNPIIKALDGRANEDGIAIEGTYIQYFLPNQRNIQGGATSNLRKYASDNDLCKAYWRFKEDNITYFIIDQNIGSVGMGEGNESLFQRFFAKLDPVSGVIEEYGAIANLVRLAQAGYLDLISTNNIGTYYAFKLTDEEIKQYFWANTPDEITLMRAKIAVMRYFSSEVNTLYSQVGNVLMNKISAGGGFEEIASVYGKTIDVEKVKSAAGAVIQNNFTPVEELTQDERQILTTRLNIYNSTTTSNSEMKAQGQAILSNLLQNSIASSSQIMAFALR